MKHHAVTNQMAISATLHCLTGCAIGEMTGMILGMLFDWTTLVTVIVAVSLAFLFGYTLSLLPLLKAGLTLTVAMPLVLAADTLSIAVMEIVDNVVMVMVPGAMDAGLVNPLFWLALSLALFVAFWAAFPVNRFLLGRGKGHALLHAYHDTHHRHHEE